MTGLLRESTDPWVELASDRVDATDRASLRFERPEGVLRLEPGDDVEAFFAAIERASSAGLWAAGYFTYEAGYLFEPRLSPLLAARTPDGPLAWIGLFRQPETGPHRGRGASPSPSFDPGACTVTDLRLDVTRGDYLGTVERIRSYIAEGETYQVNFTAKVRFDLDGTPDALYRRLRRRQSVSYAAHLFDGERTIVSLSPELFLRREGDSMEVRPMKGTVRRGATPEEDDRLVTWLAGDPKNRAENVMIVDMVRNDLGRIAEPGSVEVIRLYDVERYETVHQMTSTVRARVPEDTPWLDVFRALYPCASVTGAPKIRTMELIAELEHGPRGVYTGAIGYIAPRGAQSGFPGTAAACFSVAIRTIVVDRDGHGEMGIGSGIVYDSDPEAEYDECVLKGKFLSEDVPAFSLVETMRLDGGEYALRDRHVERLLASAAHFGFPVLTHEIEEKLDALASRHPTGTHRVRLLLDPQGNVTLTAVALEPTPPRIRVRLSDREIDPDEELYRHKTTRRPLYDHEAESARAAGFDEVLFHNTRGEVTEGSYTNVFVEIDGTVCTPPLSSGLLPGTLRAEMLARGECVERVVTIEDLHRADRIQLGNSVRGLIDAELESRPS